MKKYIKSTWFTLIEIIVSVSIISIVMVSIFMIFFKTSEINRKIDLGRIMQENVKNIVETISEDIRVNSINIYDSSNVCHYTNCHTFSPWDRYSIWSKLFIWNNTYYLAKKDLVFWFLEVWNISECSTVWSNCYIVRNNWSVTSPLSNSWIQVNDLSFYVSNHYEKKVTVNITLQPASKKWINSSLIKENKITFQTTLSERLYKDY